MIFPFYRRAYFWILMLSIGFLCIPFRSHRLRVASKKSVLLLVEAPSGVSYPLIDKKNPTLDLFADQSFHKELTYSYQAMEPPSFLSVMNVVKKSPLEGKNKEKSFEILSNDEEDDGRVKFSPSPTNLRGPSHWSCLDFLKLE